MIFLRANLMMNQDSNDFIAPGSPPKGSSTVVREGMHRSADCPSTLGNFSKIQKGFDNKFVNVMIPDCHRTGTLSRWRYSLLGFTGHQLLAAVIGKPTEITKVHLLTRLSSVNRGGCRCR